MSTFRRVNLKTKQKIISAFPMLKDEYWDDSPLLESRCVSIWNKWLYQTDTPNLLSEATPEQEQEWQTNFDDFHLQIIENFDVYQITRRPGIFKEIANNTKAVEKLSDYCFLFLIPEIKVIYSSGFDYTSHIYFQDFDLAKRIFKLVEDSPLKFLNDRYA